MPQYTIRAAAGTLLFQSHLEARALWSRLVGIRTARAAVLMPNHIHVYTEGDERAAVAAAAQNYAQSRNRLRGETGPVWQPVSVTEVSSPAHARRLIRYIHLNPCRRGIVCDPLAWPWSTHRDALGLAAIPIIPRRDEWWAFHTSVSRDHDTSSAATPVPECDFSPTTLDAVAAATSAVFRLPVSALRRRGPARTAAIRAAHVHEIDDHGVLAEWAGCDRSTVSRVVAGLGGRGTRLTEPLLAAVVRVVGDARFPALRDGVLHHDPLLRTYRGLR